MRPIDLRDAQFSDLTAQLVHLRLSVYEAFQEHGPGTTRQVAHAAGVDLLTLRPRVTELVQLGFLELTGHDGHEGIYRARTHAQTETWLTAQQNPQLSLAL